MFLMRELPRHLASLAHGAGGRSRTNIFFGRNEAPSPLDHTGVVEYHRDRVLVGARGLAPLPYRLSTDCSSYLSYAPKYVWSHREDLNLQPRLYESLALPS